MAPKSSKIKIIRSIKPIAATSVYRSVLEWGIDYSCGKFGLDKSNQFWSNSQLFPGYKFIDKSFAQKNSLAMSELFTGFKQGAHLGNVSRFRIDSEHWFGARLAKQDPRLISEK
jgi:hypothetical protein